MIKNAIYRVDNGSDFDEIHFKTNPNQVVFDDGETFQQKLDSGTLKGEQVYVNVEGCHISTDSSVGYAKDIEILGNTVQDASNLADIRSVGVYVEGQELYEIPVVSVGKNKVNQNLGVINSSYGGAKTVCFPVKPNTTYIYTSSKYKGNVGINETSEFIPHDTLASNIVDYLIKLNDISSNQHFTTSSRTKYIFMNYDKDSNIQIEEGTVATPYEPYQEDKLTILSPVQLEKVGDVADRIIEKDGVWGVEKNVITKVYDGTESWELSTSDSDANQKYCTLKNENSFVSSFMITAINNRFIYGNPYSQSGACLAVISNQIRVRTFNGDETLDGFKTNLKELNLIVKYPASQPTFIPLPHDQQVKLRTFANKTNISFLTEIEGTIKAQVPKSLGATVNTHTEQINNLNKELDRVKKLEESTVSTVTTESGFTTVEATNNGYFEDVKLEGKTLVNLCTHTYDQKHDSVIDNGSALNYTKHPHYTQCDFKLLQNLKQNTTYTIVLNATNFVEGMSLQVNFYKYGEWIVCSNTEYVRNKGVHTILLTTNENIADHIRIGKMDNEVENLDEYVTLSKDIIVLEGDHTQNPPSYFEGLKSVGQSATTSEDGADEIVVSSVKGDGNLIIDDDINLYIPQNDAKVEKTTEGIRAYNRITGEDRVFLQPFRIRQGSNVTISFDVKVDTEGSSTLFYLSFLDANFNVIATNLSFPTKIYTTSFERLTKTFDVGNANYIRIELVCFGTSAGATYKNIMVSNHSKPYTPHQSDKKRLLYYNNETQTWEKPILRKWDSIEKHADGKYYYHQRSGEVVLNGSERWATDPASANMINRWVSCENIKANTIMLCDKFNYEPVFSHTKDKECIGNNSNNVINLALAKSRLVTPDVEGFKQWLQANNVTVVYQLAQKKVYECINIDLITYASETNYVVESGAIAPRTTLKVHINISNVVGLLQKKVSLLESNVKASQEVQDMMILETDMRMLDIELALMEFIPMKLNLGGSDMLRSATYFNFLKNHIINETYEKEYLENVMNKYLATGRINQDEYNELYKMLYPPVYDIELPIEY